MSAQRFGVVRSHGASDVVVHRVSVSTATPSRSQRWSGVKGSAEVEALVALAARDGGEVADGHPDGVPFTGWLRPAEVAGVLQRDDEQTRAMLRYAVGERVHGILELTS